MIRNLKWWQRGCLVHGCQYVLEALPSPALSSAFPAAAWASLFSFAFSHPKWTKSFQVSGTQLHLFVWNKMVWKSYWLFQRYLCGSHMGLHPQLETGVLQLIAHNSTPRLHVKASRKGLSVTWFDLYVPLTLHPSRTLPWWFPGPVTWAVGVGTLERPSKEALTRLLGSSEKQHYLLLKGTLFAEYGSGTELTIREGPTAAFLPLLTCC